MYRLANKGLITPPTMVQNMPSIGVPDYAPSSAKPRGLQNVRESVCWSLLKAVCFIRRLYSSPSFNRQPPAKGMYNVLEAGVYRGLARYAWLKMVRNQEAI